MPEKFKGFSEIKAVPELPAKIKEPFPAPAEIIRVRPDLPEKPNLLETARAIELRREIEEIGRREQWSKEERGVGSQETSGGNSGMAKTIIGGEKVLRGIEKQTTFHPAKKEGLVKRVFRKLFGWLFGGGPRTGDVTSHRTTYLYGGGDRQENRRVSEASHNELPVQEVPLPGQIEPALGQEVTEALPDNLEAIDVEFTPIETRVELGDSPKRIEHQPTKIDDGGQKQISKHAGEEDFNPEVRAA